MTITVTRQGDRWVARFPWSIETKDVVKAAGFKFDGLNKYWWTADPKIAAKLDGGIAAAVSRINIEREAAHQAAEASIVASRSSASDFAIPLSETVRTLGWGFLPYQKAGVQYALGRRDTLLADEMGLGKTVQVLGLVNADPSIKNVLVICPASLKLNWQREAIRWLARPFVITVLNGGAAHTPADPTGSLVITNYDMVGKQRPAIDGVQWDLLVCDESHYLKNAKAQRTHNVLGSFRSRVEPIRAKRRMFLTGTPILNRPCELWTLVHALDPFGLGRNWKGFHERYCAAHIDRLGHWDVKGASNLDELQGKLRGTVMVRRLKSEVLLDLPAKRRQIIALEPVTAEAKAAVAAEAKFVKDTEEQLTKLRAELEALSDDEASEAYQTAAFRLREAQVVAFTETSKVRHRVALAKLPQVVEHVTDCLEAVDKIVVWAHHHDVVDQLHEALSDHLGRAGAHVLKADGRDSVADRDSRVQLFQQNPQIRVLICGIGAMGVGHTMTAASHAVFAELDWVPGNLSQAEDRCHRIGQRNAVLVQHLVLDGSMDARMAQMIVEKMGVIEQTVDHGGHVPEADRVKMPVIDIALPKPAAEPAGEYLAPEVVQAIHQGLRILAGVCDGAVARDGQGFNGTDTGYGHSLANQDHLSQRQAQAARRMILKYVRQLPAPLYAVIKGGRG